MMTPTIFHTLIICEFGDNEIWTNFKYLVAAGSDQTIQNLFQYSICSVLYVREGNYLYYIIKGYLVYDSSSLRVNQRYWNYFLDWLKDNMFSTSDGDMNPLENKIWVTDQHDDLIELADVSPILQKYILSMLSTMYPIKSSEEVCGMFTDYILETSFGDVNALVIEEYQNTIRYPYNSWCCSAKNDGLLNPTRLKKLAKIHIIYPNTTQVYHTFGLERNTHYSVPVRYLNCFKWICSTVGLQVVEYLPSINISNSGNLCVINCDTINIPFQQIYNTMKERKKKGGLRNRNDIWLVSYGYSGRVREYIGGPPSLTKGIGKHDDGDNTLVKLALPILEILTENILHHFREKICVDEFRNELFADRIGENFHLRTQNFNLFEGFDFAISSALGEKILAPHCDVMNDWRPGHNYCSVAKSIVSDDENGRPIQVVFIAYTRKDIGDYLYGASKFLSR